MKINGKEVNAKYFAYDGCHKIYILNNNEDMVNARKSDYKILPIDKLEETYNHSCSLRFIRSWDLEKVYVGQMEHSLFEY